MNTIAKGRLYLGKLSHNLNTTGTRNCQTFFEWELREGENGPEFSAQGEVWNHIKTDIYIGGQCVDMLAALFPSNKQAQRLAAIWGQYHLHSKPIPDSVIEEIKSWSEQPVVA